MTDFPVQAYNVVALHGHHTMTPGKIEWKDLEGISKKNNVGTSGRNMKPSNKCNGDRVQETMTNNAGCQRKIVDMLRGIIKMDAREVERAANDQMYENKAEPVPSSSDGDPALIQCVEKLFKNSHQNEVPLHLLQEWFSDAPTHRRQELAKLFLALLQEQGINLEQVTESLVESVDSQKTEVASREPAMEKLIGNTKRIHDDKYELRCGRSNESARELRVYGSNDKDSSTKRFSTPGLISDPIVLKSLREFRPPASKSKPDLSFEPVERSKIHRPVIHPHKVYKGPESSTMRRSVRGVGMVDVGVHANAPVDCSPVRSSTTARNTYSNIRYTVGTTVDQHMAPVEKKTRSIGTSPFRMCRLDKKYSSESSLPIAAAKSPGLGKHFRGLRKSTSLPSMHYPDSPKLPPLTPIIPPKKTYASKETSTSTLNFSSQNFQRSVESKPMNNNPTVAAKPRTSFVELSHAEFIRRQISLNERVNIRQGFRVGSQILYVPELVSCSAPRVEKPTPPLLVHSNSIDLKRSRNPVEIKVMVSNPTSTAESVVVSHSSSSHTIHYTPSPSHIVSTPSQILNDKCSVVYVRDSLPHAQPVLVATTPSTTWQEEARKKPIIAYAKRKPPEPKDKTTDAALFTDGMKVLLTPNGLANSLHESQAAKVITPNRTVEREQMVGANMTVTKVASASNGTSLPANDLVFGKRSAAAEERATTNALIPEDVAKPHTLPKFNQTFVQNFQLKPISTDQAPQEPLKIQKGITAPYSTVVVPSPSEVTKPSSRDVGNSPDAAGRLAAQLQPSSTGGVIQSSTANVTPITPTGLVAAPAAVASAPSAVTVPVAVPALTPTLVAGDRSVSLKTMQSSPSTAQVGLLIYTQGTPEDANAVQTLLLTTLPNGSAYCVRLPPNTGITPSATPAQIESPRPSLVMQVPTASPVSATKSPLKKAETLPVAPPAESNKVALLKDLKEFENVFEETKLKFEKENQLGVADPDSPEEPESPVPAPASPPPLSQPTTISVTTATNPIVIPKFECEKVMVGVKRKPDGDIPVVTRLYTTAKKPLIVVANYGQPPPLTKPVLAQGCNTNTITHVANKSPKSKSRTGKTFPNPSKSPPTAKPQQKPQEDEKTQQKIFAILEEYAVQKEHSPDTNNRPAPRRRSNPPSSSVSKKKRPTLKTKDASNDSEDGSFSEM